MRKKLIAGNWKMAFSHAQAVEFATKMKSKLSSDKADVVVCPSTTSLVAVKEALADSGVMVGAQNVHYMDKGAYTGETSAKVLQELGIPYVLIGHSERREKFAETDTTVNLKLIKALECKLTPIVCVGESQKQRKENRTSDVLKKQISIALNELSAEDVKKTVIAYEPIWAIGTGETATNEQAEEACKFIRGVIQKLYGADVSEQVRILYGGSVTEDNANDLFKQPNIDGGLVGGASLKESFEKVVHFG